MNPVEPTLHEGGSLVIFAKDQPPYQSLPASVDEHGTIVTEWEFTAEELQKIFEGGRIRLWIMFTEVHKGKSLTPIRLEVIDQECDFGP